MLCEAKWQEWYDNTQNLSLVLRSQHHVKDTEEFKSITISSLEYNFYNSLLEYF